MYRVVQIAAASVFCLVVSTSIFSQQPQTTAPPATSDVPPESSSSQNKAPVTFHIAEDTPVRMKLARTMSSKDARLDERVDFEVLEDVKVAGVVVIERGAMALATVTEAHPKKRMGRSGKLRMNIDYVRLATGDKVPLRAVKGGRGGDHIAAMTGAMVATSIVFFPAAPLFLFMHGKDITIPKGTEITAYVAAPTPLDPAKFTKQTSRLY
jgi:hypothetical protein